MKKSIVLLFFVLLLSSQAFAVLDSSKMKIFAVTNEGNGLGAELQLQLEPGNGTVWVASEPLVGTSTQSAAKLAVQVAKNYAKNTNKYDYKFRISSNASLVEGPSAGAAMTLLIISMLNDKPLNQQVSLTGTINEDGSVGPIGGAFEKTKAAAQEGIKLFMIPKGEAVQTVRLPDGVKSINMLDYGPKELGVKIVEVSTIDDVLKYAYSDIQSIDVNKTAEQVVPDFVPKSISYGQNLAPMKNLTNNYLKETSQLIESARTSVSTTLIDDPSLINALLETLNSSQQTMHQAEILNDQNYLYSAANFAFLARVNAMVVKDISENPAMLEPGSTIFRIKLDTLNVDIENLRESLNRYVPADYFEWQISAQQRTAYAQLNYEKLNSTQVVVVQTGEKDYQALFDQITDYEFAVAWVDVAKDFYAISKDSTMRTRIEPAFMGETADKLIIEAENKLSPLDKTENEDIFRRLNAAKLERQYGWNAAAAFDASSAIALVQGESEITNKSYDELKSMLEEKISGVENKIKSSLYSYAWPSLYLAHSKYFLESAQYYTSQNQGSTAINSLRNGISLIALADNLIDTSNPAYSHYSNLDQNQFIKPGEYDYTTSENQAISDKNGYSYAGLYFALGSISLFLALLLVILTLVLSRQQKRYSIPTEIIKVKELRRKADEAFLQGKIKEQKHNELLKRYDAELKHLESIRKRRLSHLLDIDAYKAELASYETRLKELEGFRKEGLLDDGEFKAKSEQFRKKISGLKSLVNSQKNALSLESNELKALADSEVLVDGKQDGQQPKARQEEKSNPKGKSTNRVYGRKNFSKAQQKKPSSGTSKKGPSETMKRIAGEAISSKSSKKK
jgi:uncharacterized protein